MHLTQDRFIRTEMDRSEKPSHFERKAYGASYLVHVPTTNHGDFSSYAALGIACEGPGYWTAPLGAAAKPLYEGICQAALAFFDGHLKGDLGPLEKLLQAGPGSGRPGFRIEHKEGQAAPPAEAVLIDLITGRGIAAARPEIERLHAAHPGAALIGESVLNWLGVHFQYWWGREDEALGIFELNVVLHPGSSSALDALGEAYAGRGRTDEAVRCFKKSLEIDPQNKTAKAAIERLAAPPKKGPAA
jgi:tetratricopeptide (TPR) repeat protein